MSGMCVVNYYPDSLLQIGTTVYSLLQRPNINKDGTTITTQDEITAFNPNTYSCRLITRPMKLENALALKSIMQIRHITDFKSYTITTEEEDSGTQEAVTVVTPYKGSVTLRIFASNNLDWDWVQLGSLRGKPWKYYRFRYDFSNLTATDRFAGSIIVTQERRTDKLR